MKADHIPNKLINSSSPYLLQHAYNPVNWFPWGEEALLKAREEDKLIIVSIGYSACHWCHVMEHESFEDYEVAEIMNQHFVCIKVDREERPDIDQVYMSAVQLMTNRGGWPLNCITLPDTRPVYGGTYFPKAQWKTILLNLATIYKKDREKFEDYAGQLTEGIKKHEEIVAEDANLQFDEELIATVLDKWKKYFDIEEGGSNHAPKFPMPSNYRFLTGCCFVTDDENLKTHVRLTLHKMAYGGIYDHVGGGFSRYSVDGQWKVPHFEKMLYDNAQLISLYSDAFRLFEDPLYKEIVYQTIDFVKRELTGDKGNLYSALDADSEGKEGKFYIWTKEEFQSIAGSDFPLLSDYFNINENGYWEDDFYILLKKEADSRIALKYTISEELLQTKIQEFRLKLLAHRSKRIRPGLDDKTLTSWNALMITAYLDAFDAFGEKSFLGQALEIAEFILAKQLSPDGNLMHNYKNGNSTINGFLEDYAFFIHSLIRMYQSTFEIKWLNYSKDLMSYALKNFNDQTTGMFYFTSSNDTPLIARKMEVQDNVIPASNSQMAINLFFLGNYFENNDWIEISKTMLSNMKKHLAEYPLAYSNWLLLWLYYSQPLREVVICGEDALEKRNELVKEYLYPGIIIAGCEKMENISLTQHRLVPGKTLIYICEDKSCKMPAEQIQLAFPDLKRKVQ